jgi:hypothetical protein
VSCSDHQCNTHSLQVRRYQRLIGLWWWAGRCPGSRLGVFRLVRANRDPHLLAEEVAKRGKVFGGWRVGRWSYLPLFLIFVLLLNDISRRFKLRGSFLPPCPLDRPGGTPNLPPLPLCPLLFIIGTIGLPPHRIIR